ncbi:MAG: cysteine--D-myo-inosityl 2-amino-2-deoxy-alpha-D-glucopyranoside ligase, partial [Actinomycetia bacterium]|nr:cysteine--D-myo-inosityl 2-amino-2-deoxy-alpha-D-glucopyranoside ligase [Actinomycetes bacterium]
DALTAAQHRIALWRSAVDGATGPDAEPVLARVRERLSDDLDSPAAIAAIDRWAREAASGQGEDKEAPQLVRTLADALLGVKL